MQMTQNRFESFIAEDMRKVFEVLVEVLMNDIKIDFCVRRELIEKLGFVFEEGVMCLVSDNKATLQAIESICRRLAENLCAQIRYSTHRRE